MTSRTADDSHTSASFFPAHCRVEALIVWRRSVLAVLFALAAGSAVAQTCNPVIDGTYCEDNIVRAAQPKAPGVRAMPGAPFGNAFSITTQDHPATLGAITFNSDGQRCVGLVRRFSCK
jgi:hypothetical protein